MSTLTERQKYFYLVAETIEALSPEVVERAVRNGAPEKFSQLENVRIGRSPNLPKLITLIEIGLPDYSIPAHLRPAG
ncbi:hypothetical protein [Hymenobacter sp. B81]|uniref:hypothetical protein n=1 Tax=Hymenobacter sp. B81 TaxID=3344878 RepID=UPI0037DC14FE